MRNVVAGDHQVLAKLVFTSQHDMAVGIVGVEVIDRHPVEARVEIALHLGHQAANEGRQIVEFGAVLGRDDEAELMAVTLAALQKILAVRLVARRVIEPAGLALPRDAIALDISEVRLRRADPLTLKLDDPRLDDDAAPARHPPAPHCCARPPSAAASDPRPAERLGAETPETRTSETGGMQHPLQICFRLLAAAGADLPEFGLKAVFVVGGHGAEISARNVGDKVTSSIYTSDQCVTPKRGVGKTALAPKKRCADNGISVLDAVPFILPSAASDPSHAPTPSPRLISFPRGSAKAAAASLPDRG